MAGHLLITDKYVGETDSETKAIRNLIKEVRDDLRKTREDFDFSSFDDKYDRLPDDFLDEGETEAYQRSIIVPETIVYGGRATLELHLKWSRISKVYLVA